MEDEKYYYYERQFLNKKHGRAYSIASVQKDVKPRKASKYAHSYVDVYLELADCTEHIQLDFSFDLTDAADQAKQVAKLDQLIQTCMTLREKMLENNDKALAAYKKWKKKHDKKK